jgi:myo-inositol 2-dehydrogenase/D-chiro-inositol 1-dehydrogenase
MSLSITRRLRLGIFGVGRMGRVHLEHLVRLHETNRIELVAIGDRWPPFIETALSLVPHAVKVVTTSDEMAADAGVDAAVVVSRTSEHARDILAFVRRGIPVLVEKPLVRTVAEAAAIVGELGADADRLVQVAFQRQYDEATRLATEWVSRGAIGSIQQSHHVLQDKNPTPVGYESCGITADMAIHLVHEAMSFRGFELPRRVQALQFMSPPYEDRAREGANIVHVFCQWAGGSLAHLWGSRINGTGYDNGFTLTGTDGRIDVGAFVGDFGPISARLWQGTGNGSVPRGSLVVSREFPMTPPREGHPDFYARFAAAYEAELCEFVRRAAAGAALDPGLEVGWKTLLVANLAEASARDGGVFELAQPDGSPIESASDAAAFAMKAMARLEQADGA